MASRNFTLNDGSIFTLYYDSAGYGFGEISFKRAAVDGTDYFGETDLRPTAEGESETFAGATLLSNGNLRVFFAAYPDFGSSDISYKDFDATTGLAVSGEVPSPASVYLEEFETTFPLDSTYFKDATSFLTLADGSMAMSSSGFILVLDQSGATTGFAFQTGGGFSTNLVEVDGKILEIASVQNFVSGANPQEGLTEARFYTFDPNSVILSQGADIQVSQNFHVLQQVFGLGFNSVDSAVLTDGRIAVAYSDFLYANGAYDSNRQSVFVAVINPDGTTDVSEFMASTGLSAGDTIRPEVYALYDGGFALVINTTMGFPQFNQSEVRVFDETGVETAAYILAQPYNPETIYVAPSGEVWLFDDGETSLLLEFDVDGGPAPVGITLNGTSASETLDGSAYDDVLDGKNGNDTLNGLDGNDRLIGGNGEDILNGDDGRDVLLSGAGRDTLNGGTGADKLNGGNRPDMLFGGIGNDLLKGGSGADHLYGNEGNDKLRGGLGEDKFIFSQGDGSDIIRDFNDGQDEIVILDGASDIFGLTITANGGDAKVTFADVEIVLQGIDSNDLSNDDFAFSLL